MGDLKTFWTNPGGGDENPGLEGTTITGRGTDPMVTIDAPNGVDPIWPNPPVAPIGGEETPNSVSGLPAQPNRFEPTATPPEPPSLKDRNPGTIDER